MIKYKIVDSRLAAAASYGRPGKVVADIGTDHASLPIYLVGNGFSPKAVACDINKGPLDSAKRNITLAFLSDKIDTLLTDGLRGVDAFLPEDIYILGMGGELIWRIINDSEYAKTSGVRLILQPMTHAQDLRNGLYSHGFNIIDESLVCDRDRVYQIIVAEFDGIIRSANTEELWLGKINIERGGAQLSNIAATYARALKKKIDGCSSNGLADTETQSLYERFLSLSRLMEENQ
jgi:tRNA (adenine22-N1)-methyltransferase